MISTARPSTTESRRALKLDRDFYLRDTVSVAKALLGQRLVHVRRGRRYSGLIVETEAYLGLKDPACHSFHGKVTERTKAFYLNGGHSYVYLIYGMHHCFNVVCGDEKTPEAILVRALAMEEGRELVEKRLNHLKPAKVASGPGRLCSAMGIDKSLNGVDLCGDKLFIEKGGAIADSQIVSCARVNVDYAGDAAGWPLRFHIKGHPAVSSRPEPKTSRS